MASTGVIAAVVSLPYLTWPSKKKFNKKAKVDAVMKAVFNQMFISQVLNMLFLSYFAMLKVRRACCGQDCSRMPTAMRIPRAWTRRHCCRALTR